MVCDKSASFIQKLSQAKVQTSKLQFRSGNMPNYKVNNKIESEQEHIGPKITKLQKHAMDPSIQP